MAKSSKGKTPAPKSKANGPTVGTAKGKIGMPKGTMKSTGRYGK